MRQPIVIDGIVEDAEIFNLAAGHIMKEVFRLRRMRRLAGNILRRVPWLRRHLFASIDYKVISRTEAKQMRSSGWLSCLTALRQERAYESLLKQMHKGKPRVDFLVAAAAIKRTGLPKPRILEVGCGNGYYSEVFAYLLDRPFEYLGLDCSAAMVESSKTRYPNREFQVADACNLPFPDASFDIVFNGVSLMHIIEFESAIAESRRTARSYCIFHSVPVFQRRDTTYLRKYAYGSLVMEVTFNREALMGLFEREGLEFLESWKSIPYDVYPAVPEHSHTETFLVKPRGLGRFDNRPC